jgi:hypothetical protein
MEHTFTVKGQKYAGNKETVELKMAGVEPEPTNKLVVEVNGKLYPVKQAFSESFGIDRADFISHQARSIMQQLGFKVKRLM